MRHPRATVVPAPIKAPERTSDEEVGRGANRRCYGNVAAVLRLMPAIGRRCVHRPQRQRRECGRGQVTCRQVFNDLARGTVVIDGMVGAKRTVRQPTTTFRGVVVLRAEMHRAVAMRNPGFESKDGRRK